MPNQSGVSADINGPKGQGPLTGIDPQGISSLVNPEKKVEVPPRGPHSRAEMDLLFSLLKNGQIEDFNKVRPAGALDFRGRDFSGLNLRGADFRHANLSRALFRGCDLSDARFQKATLDRSDLSDTTLTRAKFFEASLRFAQLERVKDAFQAEFQSTKLKSATLDEGNFSGALFNDAQLVSASLVRARFNGAQFVDAKLLGATMTGATFEGANMQRVRMFQANGKDVCFKDANLVDGEAVASYFTSSSDDLGKPVRLNFDGAWVKGFRQNGEIAEVFLSRAKRSELPPEGSFAASPPPSVEKILVNGIPGSDKVLYDQALAELDELIGLQGPKAIVRKLVNHLMVNQVRLELGEPELDYVLHALYIGPQGTGKTSVARIVAKLLYAVGAMPSEKMIEVSRAQLVAEYQGQTAPKTNAAVDSAMGGSLVVDEAYSLKNSENDSYGAEAIAALVKRLEDDRKNFACIMTGYPKEMEEFLSVNSGLRSRFPFKIYFDHYSTGELVDIMKLMLDKKHFRYSREFLGAASMLIAAAKAVETDKFGNGRTVRNTYEKMALAMSERLVAQNLLVGRDREKILTPTTEDLPSEDIAHMPLSALPALSELRWKHPGSNQEVSIDQIDLDRPFPCLTKGSFEQIVEAINAFRAEKREERAAADYV